jgi:ADP-dependent NAD(P)H-hydrate dehydratase / NAD(P)H-hydrate epimerase
VNQPVAPTSPSRAGKRANLAGDGLPLPADDPELFGLDLRGLRRRWADAARRSPIGAEAMAGADRRAQIRGIPGQKLMEHAGTAVAAAAKALAEATGRWRKGPVLILCGPGNNGGDGMVAARRLARAGADVAVILVSAESRPRSADAARNWDRLDNEPKVTRSVAGNARDLGMLGKNVDKASIVVDALLGTGVRGALREPIRSAIGIIERARAAKVPVLAVDTPTAVDLSSGDPSEPAAHADLTVTFHRPKTGLLTGQGAALAGKVLVAPIGIPLEADRG